MLIKQLSFAFKYATCRGVGAAGDSRQLGKYAFLFR